ncbi:MAG TPA: hypothetical protein VGQ81_04110, partial [Acidobacteriota bacterium]|nr:hypothetical protein [Acidobacteriota bacterium]
SFGLMTNRPEKLTAKARRTRRELNGEHAFDIVSAPQKNDCVTGMPRLEFRVNIQPSRSSRLRGEFFSILVMTNDE